MQLYVKSLRSKSIQINLIDHLHSLLIIHSFFLNHGTILCKKNEVRSNQSPIHISTCTKILGDTKLHFSPHKSITQHKARPGNMTSYYKTDDLDLSNLSSSLALAFVLEPVWLCSSSSNCVNTPSPIALSLAPSLSAHNTSSVFTALSLPSCSHTLNTIFTTPLNPHGCFTTASLPLLSATSFSSAPTAALLLCASALDKHATSPSTAPCLTCSPGLTPTKRALKPL